MRTVLLIAGLAVLVTSCSAPSQPGGGGSTNTDKVAAISIAPPTIALQAGKTLQVTATPRDSAGNVLGGLATTWSSSDTNIAKISTTGMLTARGEGSASVHVEIGGKSADAPVAIAKAPVASVTVSPGAPSVAIANTVQFTASTLDASGNALSGRTISWSSSNTAVATISAAGVAGGVTAGTVTITATSEGVSGHTTLTVTTTAPPPPPPVATVTVSLGASSVTAGQGTQATAVLKDAGGNVLTGRIISWSSSNTAAATVNAGGAVTSLAAGTAKITATSEGKSGFATLTVTAPVIPVATVTVSLGASSLTTGQTTPATAVTKDAGGNVLTGRSISWSSSNTTVATVSSSGLVSALAAGTAQITATSESKSGSANLTVSASTSAVIDTIFYDGFESGDLSAWQDGVNPTKHQVITDASTARVGSRYLQITYPANEDGGWLTRFFMPGYDSVYVRYYVRFTPTWTGSTKLLLLRGSRTDNQWSSFGVAGQCPVGTDFFATNVVTDVTGSPGPALFYSYFPTMSREPDGVTCWGRYSGQGTTTYPDSANTMSRGAWHMVEFWVKLNKPGSTDAVQRMWVDGVLKGEWTGLSFRTSSILQLNSVTLEASAFTTSQVRTLLVDDVLVTNAKP
jgi:uncharacterized protein YjdB